MGSQLSEFKGTGTMAGPQKHGLLIAILLAALPVIAVAALLVYNDRQSPVEVTAPVAAVDPADRKFFDQAASSLGSRALSASELTGLRWQAMVRFYEKNGLLTRETAAAVDPADVKFFDQAASSPDSAALPAGELSGLRWQAMAKFYKKNGLLINEPEASVAPEYAFYTERYWRMAEESRTAKPPVIEREAAAADAFYTERYWKMAEESRTGSLPLLDGGIDAPEPAYAFYTERYWKMAAESAAPATAPEESQIFLNGKLRIE